MGGGFVELSEVRKHGLTPGDREEHTGEVVEVLGPDEPYIHHPAEEPVRQPVSGMRTHSKSQ